MATLRNHSVLTPEKLSRSSLTKDIQLPLHSLTAGSIVRQAHDIISNLSGPAKDIARAQLYSGARAVEILSLTTLDMEGTGFVCINARKGSQTRTSFLPHLLPYKIAAIAAARTELFPQFSYSKYRRQLKAAAGNFLPSTCHRDVLSNLFRRASAEIATRLSGGAAGAAQHALGHKRESSTKYYLTKED